MAKAKAAPKLPKDFRVVISLGSRLDDFIEALDDAVSGDYHSQAVVAEKIIDRLLSYVEGQDACERIVARLNDAVGVEYVKKVDAISP
jgi:hypothetical protein